MPQLLNFNATWWMGLAHHPQEFQMGSNITWRGARMSSDRLQKKKQRCSPTAQHDYPRPPARAPFRTPTRT